MYSGIAANKRKTVLIMMIFLLVLAGIGYAVELYTGNFASFVIIFVIALIWAVISYFISAKMALSLNGAKEITKKDNPRLWRAVENLSITDGLPMPRVYIINDPAPNAFATGRDPDHASVAVTSGLLQIMTDTELEAVLAHEMGHVKNYDTRVMLIVFACVTIIGVISDILLRMFWFGGDDRDGGGSQVGMILAIVLAILSPIIAMLVQLAVSRQREYLADATSAMTTRYPEGLISALSKIGQTGSATRRQSTATAHLFFANPLKGRSFSKLLSTHPPIAERIARLQKMETNL
jgi:heat shock protein HtpX